MEWCSVLHSGAKTPVTLHSGADSTLNISAENWIKVQSWFQPGIQPQCRNHSIKGWHRLQHPIYGICDLHWWEGYQSSTNIYQYMNIVIEDWGPRTEDWELRIEDRGLRIEEWGLKNWELRTEDWGLMTEDSLTPTEDTLADLAVLINSFGPH